ncbi:AraC family transcriptional regulator [Paenibacillus sp. PK4536]|uniref:helix-turn-helix domain-containing protein n=1 Tax=Paenibacillus sp. PK4536 TaxID=3024576 RepID=UPI002358E73D|nr:AraC family transcriptional regulator [Paenibacillus sp. PK4536]WIM38158.1 AraC family transcriptional regulator [Paenibacillus sp. PK4536]
MQLSPPYEVTQMPDKTFPINIFHVATPHWRWVPLHWHEHLEWMIVYKGSFRVQIGTEHQDITVGDIVFVNTRQIHAAFPLEEDTELICIVFNEALIRNIQLDHTESRYIRPLLENQLGLPAIFPKDHPLAKQVTFYLQQMIIEYEQSTSGSELLIKSYLLACIGWLYRIVAHDHIELPASHQPAYMQPLFQHLSHHFRESISIETAAELCQLTPTYFCYLFKKTTGKTFIEYINMLRIHEAEQLLRSGDWNISQVAYHCGFTSLNYFGRVFKQYKQMSPSRWLKHIAKS